MRYLNHTKKLYTGPLDPQLIKCSSTRKALRRFYGQNARSGTLYSSREFVYWFLTNPILPTLKNPHVARLDHNKPYSFCNIELQEAAENIKERNSRRGNPCNTHKKVTAFIGNKQMVFSAKKEAAKYFMVSEKTIYNHCSGRTSQFFKFGPRSIHSDLRFEWYE